MCGILGEFVYNSHSLIDKSRFLSLLELSRNRGPDSQGYSTNDKNFQFGFNRLSILDLSGNGNQPIQSPSGRYTMVFNGEIYNHFELRKTLPRNKYIFKGSGDTESLIACFDNFGIENTVSKLDGMFAIGIYDHKKSLIHLIRDFAGIKPLHFGLKEGVLVFASQYNQISRHIKFCNENIDEEILKLYLTLHYIPSPYGILKNTYSVNPGEIVTFNSHGIKKTLTYWSFPDYNSNDFQSSNQLNDIEEKLEAAVKTELTSDVPLGSFLSGGVDSPLISYYANKNIKGDFNTFSMGSDSNVHDESMQAKLYAQSMGSNHHSTYMTAKNSLEVLDKAVESVGEPFGDYSIIPTWQVSKLAKKEVTVALSGDGGDELFFGYDRFQSVAKNHSLWGKPFWMRFLTKGIDKLAFNGKHFNDGLLISTPGYAHQGLHSRFSNSMINKLIPEMNKINFPKTFDLYNYENPRTQQELLYNIRKVEFYGMMQKTLMKVDRASMDHGLEVRVPFLHKPFIETILQININDHDPMGRRKKLLHKLLNKCYPSIGTQKIKMGFSIPLTTWIKQEYKNPFKEMILDSSFYNSLGFEKGVLENMFTAHINGNADFKWPLFTLYSLAIWMKNERRQIS